MTNRELAIDINDKNVDWNLDKIKSDSLLVSVIASILTLLTPFGMDQVSLIKGWFFWLTICFVGYFIYAPMIFLGNRWLLDKFSMLASKHWLRILLLSTVASGVMSFVVPFIILTFFDIANSYFNLALQVMPNTLLLGVLISFIHTLKNYFQLQKQQLVSQQEEIIKQQQQNDEGKHAKYHQFMAKLPIEKRGKLLCLEMDDHYLKVHTDKGHHMILMRFKDALVFLEDYPGVQTHRSWWVAIDAVLKQEKTGRKLSLQLTNQQQVPVSRSFLAHVKSVL